MNATAEDYYLILNRFVDDLGKIGEDVRSAVLFGSVARGDIIAGQSDMMDAYVFLKREAFEDKSRFMRAIDLLAEAFDRIAEKAPGPFHPFFYWNEQEPVPATFNYELTRSSKIIFGQDIRGDIKSTEASREVARTAFFEMRRLGLPLVLYLDRDELTVQDCEMILRMLVTIKRDMPISACMALDIWVGQMESVRRLEEAFPGLDASVLDRITALLHEPAPAQNVETLRSLLRQAIELVEDLNNRIVASLNDKSKP